jgi:methylmalonyl-CoA mutase N-terminal domain/subunit
MGTADPKHKGRPGYNGAKEYGCRCDQGCGAAHERIKAAQRARRKEKSEREVDPSTFVHGINGYRTYRCRCEICAAAGELFNRENREITRLRRLRKKEEKAEAAAALAEVVDVVVEKPLVVVPTQTVDWSAVAHLKVGAGVRRRSA